MRPTRPIEVTMTKILVVEDEAIIRTALRKLLERNKYQVSEAPSVREATSKFQLNDFELIISDLRLPGAPGTDLIKLAGDRSEERRVGKERRSQGPAVAERKM